MNSSKHLCFPVVLLVALASLLGLGGCGSPELIAFSPPPRKLGGGAPRTEPPPERITFETLKDRVLQPSCMGCHRSFGSEELFKRWVVAGKPEESEAFGLVDRGLMPPRGGRLPQESVDLMEQYIRDLE